MVNGLNLYSALSSPYGRQTAVHFNHSPIHTRIQTLMVVSYIVAGEVSGPSKTQQPNSYKANTYLLSPQMI